MPSSEYSKVQSEFRQQLVDQFIRNNPGTRHDEVVVRYVNGKVVCEHVSQTFQQKASGLPGFEPEQIELLGKLENGKDLRYAAGVQSLQASKQYNERLYRAGACAFNAMDYENGINRLLRKQYQSAVCALAVHDFKKKLDHQSKLTHDPSESIVRILMMEYFETSISQLRCFESILTKEARLLEQYVLFATDYIKEVYTQLKDRLDENSIEAVKKSLGILKKAIVNIPHFYAKEDIIDKDELKIYTERLFEFEKKLAPKRKQLQPVFKLVGFLEEKMLELKNQQNRKASRMSTRRDSRGR